MLLDFCSATGRKVLRASLGTAVAVFAIATAANAQVVFLSASIDGGQETPPNNSSADGSGCFELDLSTMVLSYDIEFQGLTASETAAHIHGFAPPGTPAGILFPLPLGSPIAGNITVTADEAQGIIEGLTYVNIHTSNFPNGEIRGQIIQAPPTTRFCFGDGTSGPCPCGNASAPQSGQGCTNSAGQGGRLLAGGFASIHCDSLNLFGSFMVGGGTAVYAQGTASMSTPINFGDGLRCIGGNLVRLAVTSNFAGSSHVPATGTPPISSLGSISMPATYYYQVYYRDPDLSFCPLPVGNSWNITNAVEVTWVP